MHAFVWINIIIPVQCYASAVYGTAIYVSLSQTDMMSKWLNELSSFLATLSLFYIVLERNSGISKNRDIPSGILSQTLDLEKILPRHADCCRCCETLTDDGCQFKYRHTQTDDMAQMHTDTQRDSITCRPSDLWDIITVAVSKAAISTTTKRHQDSTIYMPATPTQLHKWHGHFKFVYFCSGPNRLQCFDIDGLTPKRASVGCMLERAPGPKNWVTRCWRSSLV